MIFSLNAEVLSFKLGLVLKMCKDSKIRKLKLDRSMSIILKSSIENGVSQSNEWSRIDDATGLVKKSLCLNLPVRRSAP